MHSPSRRTLPALFLSLACTLAGAADTMPEPVPAGADPLASARAAIQSSRWSAASDELKRLNANANADWNNLMGYVSRKQTPPDLDAAQRYYDTALRIAPDHQGALEYSGELALMKKDLPTAEARLATLARLCRAPCEALDDLKKAIARYKADNKL